MDGSDLLVGILIGVGVAIGIERKGLTLLPCRQNSGSGYMAWEELAKYGRDGVDSDFDTDSDPENNSRDRW